MNKINFSIRKIGNVIDMKFKHKLIYLIVVGVGAYFFYLNKYAHLQNETSIPEAEEVVDLLPPPLSFPVHGTIFVDSNIILGTDPSTFIKIEDVGIGERTMFDRRVDDWVTLKPFLFDATFDDGLKAEVQVNPEFQTIDAARVEANKYAEAIGRLPTALRKKLETVWIHKGKELYGGGNNNILIHTEQTIEYERDGILEETLAHEATHTSLDPFHKFEKAWKKTQDADGKFISDYAKDNPEREDIAETFLLYMAIRYRSDRISTSLRDSIIAQVPNRIKYFDSLKLDMYPIE